MQTQLDSFSRSETLCTTGEATERQSASGSCTLARPCNDHWSAKRVAVVGTPNNDSEVKQRSRSTRNSIRTVAHLVRCLIFSVHSRCHLVVTFKLQKICSWTSMNSHRHAHGTRPAAALNSLTSPIPMSLCKELKTSVFRCQEILSNLCQLRRHLCSKCHMETLHLRRHSCPFLQRHHLNVCQEERQRHVWKSRQSLNPRHHS